METLELIDRLQWLGVELWIEGDDLRYRAPRHVLTQELRALLVEKKTQLVAFLIESQFAVTPPVIPSERGELSIVQSHGYALSLGQQRLWFQVQLDANSPAHHIPVVVRIHGTLDALALVQALNIILQRHDILRTTIKTVAGQPRQMIAPTLTLQVPIVDLRGLPAAECDAEALRQARAEALLPFDLGSGPLLRATLIHLGAENHLFALTMHHIISDNWSCSVLLRELQVVYEAVLTRAPSPLAELPMQYAEFSERQRKWLTGPRLAPLLEYWTRRLAPPLNMVSLPIDHPRTPHHQLRGASLPFALGSTMTSGLRQLGRKSCASLFMTLLAAFKALVHCYTGCGDLTIGVPVANRGPETADLIGYFVNPVVIRTTLHDEMSFVQFLAQVRQIALEAYAHQELPFEKLVEVAWTARSAYETPFFNLVFNYRSTPLPPPRLSGLELEFVELDLQIAKYDLTVYMWEDAGQELGMLVYNRDLFEEDTIARLCRNFEALLHTIVAAPEVLLGELRQLIGEPEKEERARQLRVRNQQSLEQLVRTQRHGR